MTKAATIYVRERRVTTAHYDVAGYSVWKTLHQNLIFRVLPFGNFGGGPNVFYLARMLFWHTVGRLVSAIWARRCMLAVTRRHR